MAALVAARCALRLAQFGDKLKDVCRRLTTAIEVPLRWEAQ
jgi:hypothetical protein